MTLDDNLSEQELDKLAVDGTSEEMRAVARHPNTRLETLRYLASIGFAEDVDQNPMLPLYIEIGSFYAMRILSCIAEQTSSGDRLTELSSSRWDEVLHYVAWNKNTPPKVLSILAKNELQGTRLGVAQNDGTPPDTLALLAKDKDRYVRWRVANNAYAKPEVLSSLSNDEDQNVRECARVTLIKIKGIGR